MKSRWIPLLADVACVLVFVVLGRRSHDAGSGLTSMLGVAAPFLIGLAIAWAASPAVRRNPWALRAGLDVWLAAVVIGVVLRWFAWDRGVAVSFVVVAALFLGFFMLGWRVVVAGASRPRAALQSERPPLEAER